MLQLWDVEISRLIAGSKMQLAKVKQSKECDVLFVSLLAYREDFLTDLDANLQSLYKKWLPPTLHGRKCTSKFIQDLTSNLNNNWDNLVKVGLLPFDTLEEIVGQCHTQCSDLEKKFDGTSSKNEESAASEAPQELSKITKRIARSLAY